MHHFLCNNRHHKICVVSLIFDHLQYVCTVLYESCFITCMKRCLPFPQHCRSSTERFELRRGCPRMALDHMCHVPHSSLMRKTHLRRPEVTQYQETCAKPMTLKASELLHNQGRSFWVIRDRKTGPDDSLTTSNFARKSFGNIAIILGLKCNAIFNFSAK